jgi:hypothetical protein
MTSGAWSDGPSPRLASRSTQAELTRRAIESLTSARSIRMPRPFWKPSIRISQKV